MRHSALRLSSRHRRWFYAVCITLFLTGAWWLTLNWHTQHTADGTPSEWQPWLMKVHGAAAMIVLIVLGTLIPLHVRRGWHAGINRTTGIIVIAVMASLIVTAYGLYYFGSEQLRTATATVHDVIGVVSPAVVLWHILRGRAKNRQPLRGS
jgi:cation transport ATPase